MTPLAFHGRILERWLRGHRTTPADLAADYDLAAGTYGETWEAFMEPVGRGLLGLASLPVQGRILDLGCGAGLGLRLLREQGFRGTYEGVDLSMGMLARIGPEPGVTLHREDAGVVLGAMPPGTFDGVTALWSWEYLDRRRLLPLIRRVLRPGGHVVLLANRRDTLPELERAFLRLMAAHPGRIRKVFPLALRMPRSATQMGRELARVGFQVRHACQGERIRRHGTAREAVDWGFATGALAGTRCVLDLPDLEEGLSASLAGLGAGREACTTTHRYAGVVGVLPC